MSHTKRSYVEHVAIRVRDIDWHVRFFGEVLGMVVREVDGDADRPRQVWTSGGLQLVHDPSFAGPEGRIGHLGIFTEDLEAALREAEAWGAVPLPQGRNWLSLPDGLVIELLQARNDAVEHALAVNPR